MVDWVTAEVPCKHVPVNGGNVCKTDRDGEIEWQTSCFLSSVGSYDSSIQYKSSAPYGLDEQGRATHLLIHGNPSKFIQGHNVFGSDDLLGLVDEVINRICLAEGFERSADDVHAVITGQYSLRRVDINQSFELPCRQDVLAWLRAAEYCSKTRHGRPSSKGGTLYWGKSSKRWAMKAYSKGEEIGLTKKGHMLARELHNTPLQQWADNKLRIELVLRGKQLDELQINTAGEINRLLLGLFNEYLGKIEMNRQIILSDKSLRTLPAGLRSTYILWQEGHDLRSTLSRATYYRHRKALQDYNIDIALARDNSGFANNVVPLVRILEAKPAQVPSWAYDLGLIYVSPERRLKSVSLSA